MNEDLATPAKRARIIDHKGEVSGRISDTCRVIGFGLLVVYFTVIFNDSAAAISIRDVHGYSLKIMGMFGILTVFFDYLQYVFGYFSTNNALKDQEPQYDDQAWSYRARTTFFYLKQAVAFFGSILLIFIIAFPAG